MVVSRTDVFNTLTINEGTMTCSVTCEYELFRTSGTDLSINASATLSGSNATFHLRKQSASTISVASGNYGTWHILLRADTTGIVTFNLTGTTITTGTVLVWAASGGSGSNFNTQNHNLTAKSFSVGHSSNTTAIASNFGSSTVTLENGTSNTLFPVSNGGTHTLNLSSSNVNVKGNVLFVNGTGALTVTPGTSTLTWTNTSGTLTYAPSGQSLYDLVLNGSGSTVTPNGGVTITNDLTMTAGTLNGTQNITVNGHVAGTAGIISLTGGTFEQRIAAAKNFGSTSGSTAWSFSSLTFSNAHASSPLTVTTQTGGSGGVTIGSVLRIGKSGDAAGATTTLDAGNRTWTLSGTSGDPFQILSSPAGALTASTSTFSYTGANGSGDTTVQSATYYNLILNASDTFVLEAATATGNDLTITTGTLDVVSGQDYDLTIGGDYSNAGTFTAQAGTVTFSATDTGHTLGGSMTGSSAFYDLIFDGDGGDWMPNAAVDIINDLTVTAGSLLGTQDITVSGGDATGNGTINFTGGAFNLTGSGNFGGNTSWIFYNLTFGNTSSGGDTATATGSGAITVSNVLTINRKSGIGCVVNTLNGGTKTWTLSGTTGSPVVVNGDFSPGTSTVEFTGNYGSGDTNVPGSNASCGSISYNNLVLNNGSETYTVSGTSDISISNNLTIAAGAFTAGSGAATIGGNYANSGTFTHNSGTVTFNATDTGHTLGGSMTGSSAFYNLVFNGSGGGWTLNAALSANNNFDITNGTFDTNSSGNYAFTVDNNFTGNSGTWSFQMRGSTITVSGNWDTSAVGQDSVNLVEGSSNVIMNGTGTKTIKVGSTNSWETRFHDLTVGQDGNTTQISTNSIGINGTIYLGTGTFDLNSRSLLINSADATPLSLNPSGTWGTGNGSLTIFGSSNKNLPAFTYNSNFATEQNTGYKTVFAGTTVITGNMTMGCCSRASEIDLNDQTVTVNGNITFNTTTAILTMGSATLTVKGNWVNTNNAVFNADTGHVILAGTSTQTLSGTLTGASAFYDLTVTNSSGTNPSDCERTGFVASVDFAASATVTNNTTFATASSRIEFNSGSTYTLTNINWDGQDSGTRIYFRNSAASGTWLLDVSGTQTAVSYVNVSRSDASGGDQIVANDGTNVDCNNNTNWLFNVAPDVPTSLVQKRVTAGTTMSVGDWTNETQVTFEAQATDTDNPDTLRLCVEADLLGVSFSDTEDLCGSGVAYSGSPVTVSVTLTGLSDDSEYHWQVRVKDAGGAYSSWVSYGGNPENERDFGIDSTACVTSKVYDGNVEDTDTLYNDGSLTSLSANWDAFSCGVSGLNKYEYSIGTTVSGTDIKTWTDIGTNEDFTATDLILHTNQTYYANVRATDNANNLSTVESSDGQSVLPQISMSLSTLSITFAELNAGNDRSDSKTVTTNTSTNGYGGYVIRQYTGGLLTSGSYTIPMFEGGTYASPAAWGSLPCSSGSNCGYGYTSNDTTIQGSNKFNSGTFYASFATSPFGDIVADHTTAVDGSTGPVTNEQFILTHKVAVDSLQEALSYTAIVYYVVTGTF